MAKIDELEERLEALEKESQKTQQHLEGLITALCTFASPYLNPAKNIPEAQLIGTFILQPVMSSDSWYVESYFPTLIPQQCPGLSNHVMADIEHDGHMTITHQVLDEKWLIVPEQRVAVTPGVILRAIQLKDEYDRESNKD